MSQRLEIAVARKDGRPDRTIYTPAEQEVLFLKRKLLQRETEILALREEKRGLLAKIAAMEDAR